MPEISRSALKICFPPVITPVVARRSAQNLGHCAKFTAGILSLWYFATMTICLHGTNGSFLYPPPPPNFFWETSENIITNRFEYKPESFSFKLILKVIVKDSDTNFVHNFSLSSHAFLMKKSTASCFKSSIDT